MAQKANLYRRGSGVYVVRMIVPLRLREVVGKGEVHTSTETRDLVVSKGVAAGVIALATEAFISRTNQIHVRGGRNGQGC